MPKYPSLVMTALALLAIAALACGYAPAPSPTPTSSLTPTSVPAPTIAPPDPSADAWPNSDGLGQTNHFNPGSFIRTPLRQVWAWPKEEDRPQIVALAGGNGRLYFLTDKGKIYCADQNTGDILWEQSVFDLQIPNLGPVTGSLALSKDMLAVNFTYAHGAPGTTTSQLRVYDAVSGAVLWLLPSLDDRSYFTSLAHGTMILLDRNLTASLEVRSGRSYWMWDTGKDASPLYVLQDEMRIYLLNCQPSGGTYIKVVDPVMGMLQWERELPPAGESTEWGLTFAAQDAERLYLATANGLLALDKVTGEVIWAQEAYKYPPLASSANSGMAAAYGMVFVRFADRLQAFDAASGNLRWETQWPMPTSSPCLAVANGLVFTVAETADGAILVATDVRDGTKTDEVPLGPDSGDQMAIIGQAFYLWGPERDFAVYSAEDIAPIQRP